MDWFEDTKHSLNFAQWVALNQVCNGISLGFAVWIQLPGFSPDTYGLRGKSTGHIRKPAGCFSQGAANFTANFS